MSCRAKNQNSARSLSAHLAEIRTFGLEVLFAEHGTTVHDSEEIGSRPGGSVLVATFHGGSRVVDMLVGDLLRAICWKMWGTDAERVTNQTLQLRRKAVKT